MAADRIKIADLYQPYDYRILRESGDIYLKLCDEASWTSRNNIKEMFFWAHRAKDAYLSAYGLNKLDAETVYGLAVAETRLEELQSVLHPNEKEKSPYTPLPYYKEAVRLMPNGVLFNHGLARYLFMRGYKEEFLLTVEKIARVYPPSYFDFKDEPFWSLSVQEACKKGLFEATGDILTRMAAHKALYSIMLDEKDWGSAIHHYKELFNMKSFQGNSDTLINLGRLYIKNSQFVEAEKSFLSALDVSRNREKDLEYIYSLYQTEGCFEPFNLFFLKVQSRYTLPLNANVLMARSLIDSGQYNRAEILLEDMNRRKETAETFYWLARVAEIQKNWDRMELAIHKATLLDKNNIQYHRIFFKLLQKLEKYESAERELEIIISHMDKPDADVYSQRAFLKFARGDFTGASMDWQKAIEIHPDVASFYAHAAEAYLKMSNWSKGKEYYRRAIELAPDNLNYKRRYSDINGK